MGAVSGIVVFLLTWWTVIFCVLPFGLERDERGIPRAADLKQKMLITTVISVIIWLVIYLLMEADVISFRRIANAMMEKDFGP